MKESEFIELLNLYVDHEISAQDSARLETEVANNAARRKTYREYCMMHKACDLLAAHYRDPQNETPTFMVERPAVSWGWGSGLVTGGLLAAACLALVFVVHVRPAVQPGASVAANRPLPALAAADSPTFHRAIPTRFNPEELKPVLNTRDWINPSPVQNESLAWMNKVELAPIQRSSLEQLPTFEAAPLLLSTGVGATQITAPTTQDEQGEIAAFQFSR